MVSIYNALRWIDSPHAVQNLRLIPSLAVVWGPNYVKILLLAADSPKDWKAYRSARYVAMA